MDHIWCHSWSMYGTTYGPYIWYDIWNMCGTIHGPYMVPHMNCYRKRKEDYRWEAVTGESWLNLALPALVFFSDIVLQIWITKKKYSLMIDAQAVRQFFAMVCPWYLGLFLSIFCVHLVTDSIWNQFPRKVCDTGRPYTDMR